MAHTFLVHEACFSLPSHARRLRLFVSWSCFHRCMRTGAVPGIGTGGRRVGGGDAQDARLSSVTAPAPSSGSKGLAALLVKSVSLSSLFKPSVDSDTPTVNKHHSLC